jgi:hypothetical protein
MPAAMRIDRQQASTNAPWRTARLIPGWKRLQ